MPDRVDAIRLPPDRVGVNGVRRYNSTRDLNDEMQRSAPNCECDMKVLFVCTGNTCRSVLAEYLGRRFCGDAFTFQSAGIRPQRAADAENAVHILRSTFGIDASGHRPRDVRELDLSDFDLVIAIENNAATVVRELGVPESKLKMWPIRDPWGGDLTEYEKTALDIRKRLAQLRREVIDKA